MRRPETLIARGLPYGIERCDVARIFPKCRGVKIHYDRETGNSTGTAFVEFDTVQDMRQALDDHRSGRMFFRNRTFRLEHCHPKRIDIQALREQIEYAFSDTNLARDPLFQELITKDSEGWIHFDDLQQCPTMKRMGAYDEDIHLAIKSSDVVEFCGNYLRRRAPFVLDGQMDCRRVCTLEAGSCPMPSGSRSVQASVARTSRYRASQASMHASFASVDTGRSTNWGYQTNRSKAYDGNPASSSPRHTSPGRRSEQSFASPCRNGPPRCARSKSNRIDNYMENIVRHAGNSVNSMDHEANSHSTGSRWARGEQGREGEWDENDEWGRVDGNNWWRGEVEEGRASATNGSGDNAWKESGRWTNAHSTWGTSHACAERGTPDTYLEADALEDNGTREESPTGTVKKHPKEDAGMPLDNGTVTNANSMGEESPAGTVEKHAEKEVTSAPVDNSTWGEVHTWTKGKSPQKVDAGTPADTGTSISTRAPEDASQTSREYTEKVGKAGLQKHGGTLNGAHTSVGAEAHPKKEHVGAPLDNGTGEPSDTWKEEGTYADKKARRHGVGHYSMGSDVPPVDIRLPCDTRPCVRTPTNPRTHGVTWDLRDNGCTSTSAKEGTCNVAHRRYPVDMAKLDRPVRAAGSEDTPGNDSRLWTSSRSVATRSPSGPPWRSMKRADQRATGGRMEHRAALPRREHGAAMKKPRVPASDRTEVLRRKECWGHPPSEKSSSSDEPLVHAWLVDGWGTEDIEDTNAPQNAMKAAKHLMTLKEGRMYTSRWDFNGRKDYGTAYLSLLQSDHVKLLSIENGWAFCQKASGELGYFPPDFLH